MRSHPGKDGGLRPHIAGPPRLILAEPSDSPDRIRFQVIKHGTCAHSHPAKATMAAMPASRQAIVQTTRSLSSASSAAIAPGLAAKLAKLFSVELDVITDTLAGLQQGSPQCSADDLEEQAVVIVSGMCALD